jgi:hypothetical protein
VVRVSVALLQRRFTLRIIARTPGGLLLFRLDRHGRPAHASA